MSSRPRPPEPSRPDPDLERTAELPVLDPAFAPDESATLTVQVPAGAADETHAVTDNWPLPAAARAGLSNAAASAAARRQEEAEHDARKAALQDAQERLATHGQRVVQLERARDEALSAQAAAAQRAASAEQRATSAEQRAANAEQRTAQAEQRALDAERRSAAFQQRLAELEESAARVSAELAQRHTSSGQQAAHLEESKRALAAAEQQAAASAQELAQARAMVSAAGARAQQLQELLEQQDRDIRTRQAQELEQQQARALERRAHAAGVMDDLHLERARAMSYLESLQTLERRRELAQEMVTDLQHEAESTAAELLRLTRAVAAHTEHARAQETELAQRTARIAQLEQQTTALNSMCAQRDTELREEQQAAEGLRTSVARLQAELSADVERLRALEQQAAERMHSDIQQQNELQGLRAEATSLASALQEARRSAEIASARASSEQAELAQQRERTAQLEAALDSERRQSQQLEAELATVRAEMDEWGGVLRSAQHERSGHLASIATAETRVRQLEQEALTRAESAQSLQSECTAHRARVRELEDDLHAAEEALHRVEAERRGRPSRAAELETSGPRRHESAEARAASTDTNPVLGDSELHGRDERGVAEAAPDGAARLLIHSEDGREVVHVLGRKTSIGRTPDNDLQLDAKFISRHHAVILVGPVNTVIEDLNSTNGVQVNGRRIARQTLRDGDKVIIGRMHYRFALRRPSDKR
jgi:chromosome segregation ATPase